MTTDLKLSGHTTPYAVLGHPIGHTLSPVMHNASIRALGLDAIYLAFDVHPDHLLGVLPAMREMGFGGVNLTVPLKEVAFNGLGDLDVSAQRLGAVNTVEFLDDGGLRGHNTDGDGFLRATREAFGDSVAGKAVFVLGTGGAGRAVALSCAAEGAGALVLSDVDGERSERLATEIRDGHAACPVAVVAGAPADWTEACRAADMVVQCTPVGMKPGDVSLLSSEAFRAGQSVFDLIYMYPETPFMSEARAAGATVSNGLAMLLYQGASAFTIWTGQEPAVDAMRRALESAVYGD